MTENQRQKSTTSDSTTDRDLVDRSGIGFQCGIAEMLRQHYWERENKHAHPIWKEEDEEIPYGEGFADIMLRLVRSECAEDVRAIIDAKRWNKQNGVGDPESIVFYGTRYGRGFPTAQEAYLPFVDGSKFDRLKGLESRACAGEFSIGPMSPTAEHCSGPKEKPHGDMNYIARGLLQAVDALSLANIDFSRPCVFVPIVVTNARLRLLDLGNVDLDTGKQSADVAPMGAEVPFIRYTKTLSQFGFFPYRDARLRDYAEWAKQRTRTVFVTNAAHLTSFLNQFRVGSMPWHDREYVNM